MEEGRDHRDNLLAHAVYGQDVGKANKLAGGDGYCSAGNCPDVGIPRGEGEREPVLIRVMRSGEKGYAHINVKLGYYLHYLYLAYPIQ